MPIAVIKTIKIMYTAKQCISCKWSLFIRKFTYEYMKPMDESNRNILIYQKDKKNFRFTWQLRLTFIIAWYIFDINEMNKIWFAFQVTQIISGK